MVDYMIIIGGVNSSNTKKLYEIAKANCKKCICVETAVQLDIAEIEKSNKVGIMAGASTPEESIQEILEKVGENPKREGLIKNTKTCKCSNGIFNTRLYNGYK